MELRVLRYFVAVADHRGFSRAAKHLHLSQSALSRQIQSLEAELKIRLFDRIGRQIALTAEGQEFLEGSRALLQEADGLAARTGEFAGGTRGVLRFGATPQTLESLVSELLTHYRRLCPQVDVLLVEDGAASLLTQVERGLIHLAIAALPSATPLQGQPLFPLGVLAIVPPRHRLGARRAIEVTDLVDEPLLLLRPTFMTRQLFDGACQIARVHPRVVLESGSPHCLVTLAGAGHGIAIVPSTLRLARVRPQALPLRQEGRQLGVWMSIIWDPRRHVSSAARVFIQEAYRFTRRQYPGKGLRLADVAQSAPVHRGE